MMDCKQFREVLDCYVDGELSADAMASAGAHLRECRACALANERLNTLRRQVRDAVAAHVPPPDLQHRVRRSLRPALLRGIMGPQPLGVRFVQAAVIFLGIALWLGVVNASSIQDTVIGVVDQAIVHLANPKTVVLQATVMCRDCELKHRHGERTMCERIGHHGAIVTSDGRIWNVVEQPASHDLIYDNSLLGRKVRVRARLFRDAGSIAVESYHILSHFEARAARLSASS